jgi:folate-binding Fe-S cluster repair protein YgfZ
VTGEDRETFLQGQLTQDLGSLTPAAPVRFAASCDPKGRVLALLTLIRDGDGLYVALRADRADDWLAHILRYRLRARVDIAPTADRRLIAHGAPPPWGPLARKSRDACAETGARRESTVNPSAA